MITDQLFLSAAMAITSSIKNHDFEIVDLRKPQFKVANIRAVGWHEMQGFMQSPRIMNSRVLLHQRTPRHVIPGRATPVRTCKVVGGTTSVVEQY